MVMVMVVRMVMIVRMVMTMMMMRKRMTVFFRLRQQSVSRKSLATSGDIINPEAEVFPRYKPWEKFKILRK